MRIRNILLGPIQRKMLRFFLKNTTIQDSEMEEQQSNYVMSA